MAAHGLSWATTHLPLLLHGYTHPLRGRKSISDGAISSAFDQGAAGLVARDEKGSLTGTQGFQLHRILIHCAELIWAWQNIHDVVVSKQAIRV